MNGWTQHKDTVSAYGRINGAGSNFTIFQLFFAAPDGNIPPENAVKPRIIRMENAVKPRIIRMENAVKPRIIRMENAIQKNANKV